MIVLTALLMIFAFSGNSFALPDNAGTLSFTLTPTTPASYNAYDYELQITHQGNNRFFLTGSANNSFPCSPPGPGPSLITWYYHHKVVEGVAIVAKPTLLGNMEVLIKLNETWGTPPVCPGIIVPVEAGDFGEASYSIHLNAALTEGTFWGLINWYTNDGLGGGDVTNWDVIVKGTIDNFTITAPTP